MNILNPFKLNDWPIKKFVLYIVIYQIILISCIYLEYKGIYIPYLRIALSIIYISSVPGFIILRMFKIHDIDIINNILYTVGLSISLIMFNGFLLNLVLPLFGQTRPLTIWNLLISLIIISTVFLYISSKIDNSYKSYSVYFDIFSLFSNDKLIFYFVFLLSIIGTLFFNNYNNNIISLIALISIALLFVAVGLDKNTSSELYPFAIFILSLTLVYHYSLITNYLWGHDIQKEFYIANKVISSGYWDTTIAFNYNAMLSIVMLAPSINIISKMPLIQIFKIIYPLYFCLVPVALYRIYNVQTNGKVAFFGVAYFITIFSFYVELMQECRQQVAELFLVLILLLMTNKNIEKKVKAPILIIFTFSLVISHYAISYIFMVFLIFMFIYNYLWNLWKSNNDKLKNQTIDGIFVILFIILAFTWYIYNTNSSSFVSIVLVIKNINSNIADLFNISSVQALNILLSQQASLLHTIGKYMQLIPQIFIAIGIILIISNKIKNIKVKQDYMALAIINFIILLISLSVPYFSNTLDTIRIYHITLIILAPFFALGFIISINAINNIVRKYKFRLNANIIISLFIAIFLLFNTGFIYQIFNDNPASYSLNKNLDGPFFTTNEEYSAQWLIDKKNKKIVIDADAYRWMLLNSIALPDVKNITSKEKITKNVYIFLGKYNIDQNKVLKTDERGEMALGYYNVAEIISNRDQIFDSGEASIYNVDN